MSKFSDFFKNLFADKVDDSREFTTLKLVNGYNPRFISYSDNAYDNLMYRACIDAIAKQVAKLTPTVKLTTKSQYYSNLKFLLENKPNEYMNRYEFFYKVASTLFDKNNCFILRQDDVRFSRQSSAIETEAQTVPMEKGTDKKFGTGILRFYSGHYLRTFGWSQIIHV